jgi:hypothetical protein
VIRVIRDVIIIHYWSYWILIAALFAGAFATVFLFRTESVIVNDLRARLATATTVAGSANERAAQLEKEAEQLRSEAAMANANIAKANENAERAHYETELLRKSNLELEKAIAPRMLEQGASAKALEPFSGMEAYIVSLSDFEARRLAKQINFMLDRAHWKSTLLIEDDDRIMPGVELRCISGKKVSDDRQRMIDINPRAKDAIYVLADKLKQNGIDARTLAISPMMPISIIWDEKFPQNAIVIRVGLKPISESFIDKRIQDLRTATPQSNILFGNEKAP